MNRLFVQTLAIGSAGFLGAVARFLIGLTCRRFFGPSFPVGTFVINISGSLLLGWFLAFAADRAAVPDTLRLAIATGFIGTYTTFSTFMYESDALLREGSAIKAAVNLIGSLIIGLLVVRIGAYLGGG